MSSAPALFHRPLPSPTFCFAGCRLALAAIGCFLVGTCRLSAQAPGTQDSSFISVQTGTSIFTQVLENINGTSVLFVGGDRAGFNELLPIPSGTDYPGFGDEGFAPDFGSVTRIVYTAVPELTPVAGNTAPQILIGGLFGRSATQVKNSTPAQNIIRLNPNATIDMTFNPGKGADNYVTAILPQADGGMVVGGEFDQFNAQSHLYIVRLDSTGNIVPDSTFKSNLAFDANVLSLDAQLVNGARNGQILVAGQFGNVNGATASKLARLNADGTVDTSFKPSFDARATIVKSQPDGKVLVGGDFENVNGTSANHIVRLNYDGSVDPTFTASVTGMPSGFANPPAVYVIQLLDNGSMYLGGNFTTVNGVTRNYLARVDTTGALDATFDPGTAIINAVQSIALQGDGRLLVGETISRAFEGGNVYPASLIRLFGNSPEVILTATKPNATEVTGKHGNFVLTRTGNVSAASGPLTVYLQLTGTAAAGAGKDYFPLELTQVNPSNGTVIPMTKGAGKARKNGTYVVTFPTGVTTLKFKVIPTGHPFPPLDSSRTINLMVVADPTGSSLYTSGPIATVTVTN